MDLVETAGLLGANRWQTWRLAVWPQMESSLLAVWYLTYLLCLWDVETLICIVPPGGESLALRVFNLLHYGHNAQVNALCLVLLSLAALPALIWLMTRCRLAPRRGPMAMLGCVLIGVLAGGCSPPSSNEAALPSPLFSSVRVIGARGTGPGQFNKPRSVAVDASDQLYVVDMTGRVQKFNSNGVYLSSWQMPETGNGRPKGMSRDKDGNIIVVEPHYARVNHFDAGGRLQTQWGTHGTNQGEIAFPRAVAVTSNGDYWISEYGRAERVQLFGGKDHAWRQTVGRAGTGPGGFNRPEGVGVDSADNLYVADSCNHRVQVFAPDGTLLRIIGQAGDQPGQLSYPYDVRVDAQGLQFVCEFGNSRVQVFDRRAQVVDILGGAGIEPGRMNNPWAIALDGAGNLYVADSLNHRVQKFIRRATRGHAAANPPHPPTPRSS